MANKRIRKKWASRLTKDARRIAKRFKIARQEVGFGISGTIVDSTIRSDGVREITDLRIESISLVPLEQTLHPSWRVQEVSYGKSPLVLATTVESSIVEPITDAIQTAVNFASMQGYMARYPTWSAVVVTEGSIVEPIADEGRLLK